MTGYGPQEATTADELAAQARLDAAVAAGLPWGQALEDAELTSEANYRAVVRESAARPAGLPGYLSAMDPVDRLELAAQLAGASDRAWGSARAPEDAHARLAAELEELAADADPAEPEASL